MNKRGISPLIATVLIIGFTIVLAALVFQWGGGVFKDIQEQTGEQSELSILCSSGVANTEVSAKHDGSNILITIDNKNRLTFYGFLARLRDEAGTSVSVDTDDAAHKFFSQTAATTEVTDEDVNSFALKSFLITDKSVSGLTAAKLQGMQYVELFVGVKPESGEVKLCEQPFKAVIE